MGCFLGCFGSAKVKDDIKRPKNPQISSHRNQDYNSVHQIIIPTPTQIPNVVPDQKTLKKSVNPQVPEQDKPEVQILSSLSTRKKVTFDTNVKEHLSLPNKGKSEVQIQLISGTRKKVTFDSNVKEHEHVPYNDTQDVMQESGKGVDKEVVEYGTKSIKSCNFWEGSSVSSLVSFPSNHRYQNCRESDDEDEDEDEELGCEVSDLDDDDNDDDVGFIHDEYHPRQVCEYIKLCTSVESKTKKSSTCLVDDGDSDCILDHASIDKGTKTPEVFNRGARDRAGYVHSVLNPVENTAQWKTVKVKETLSIKEQKENFKIDLGFQQFSSKTKSNFGEPKNDCETVASSLSTWLVSSQSTPPSKAMPIGLEPIESVANLSSHGSNSMKSQEERPILGVLTVEELKQFSPTPSPRRSPFQIPNEGPLVGTVVVDWNSRTPVDDTGSVSSFNGIPNTTSKYREDKTVNWHSTPFETRLERALNRDTAGCQVDRRVC
ncbi:uncharacterized protein LOC130812964 isoform X2 [Amaranthus tricolor]|uniref:uncharacterized protein LOC130812964 isoform X2 n=1 Tax=Amaranthus tricolor TaxID=29722 RepID=UPI00258F4D5A|nr:uncharacterized protein LOC130812964 isoform X2 [Amaranthus tricolor]